MSRGTVLLIAGSRDWDVTEAEIEAALDKHGLEGPDIGLVVTGGAPGADRSGKEWAKKWGYSHTEFRADWRGQGRAAGPIRNELMAEFLDRNPLSPYAILFHKDNSSGTANMIGHLKRLGIYHQIFKPGELDRHIAGAC